MALLKLIGLVLMALNFLAAPVAIVWLMILGEWWAVGVAVLSLFSHVVLGLLLLPSLVLAAPAAAVARRNPHLAPIVGLPAMSYIAGLITVWCVGVLLFLMARATSESWLPLLLLAYSIGTAPWSYMAQQEMRGGGGEGSMIAVVFMQVAFVVVVVYAVVIRPESAAPVWWIFGTIMAVEVLFSLALARSAAEADAVSQRLALMDDTDYPGSAPPALTGQHSRNSDQEDLPF